MRAKVLKPFLDLKEGRERTAGEVFRLTEPRFKEIDGKLPGYVERAPERKRRAPANKAAKPADK